MDVGSLQQLEIGDDGQPFASPGSGEKVMLFKWDALSTPAEHCSSLQRMAWGLAWVELEMKPVCQHVWAASLMAAAVAVAAPVIESV
jgi:hypothetical protein